MRILTKTASNRNIIFKIEKLTFPYPLILKTFTTIPKQITLIIKTNNTIETSNVLKEINKFTIAFTTEIKITCGRKKNLLKNEEEYLGTLEKINSTNTTI